MKRAMLKQPIKTNKTSMTSKTLRLVRLKKDTRSIFYLIGSPLWLVTDAKHDCDYDEESHVQADMTNKQD
jgi:hypothetical protein